MLQSLAQQASQGDEKALSMLYRQIFPQLFRFGHSISPDIDQDSIHDAIQNVFLWLAQNYPKLKKINNIEAYLYQAVRRNILRGLSNQQKEQKAQRSYQEKALQLELEYQGSAEEQMIILEEKADDKKRVHSAISQLPEYQRTALHLRYFEERSYEEIAEMMSTNQQVVRNYVSRAIKKMRKLLQILTLFWI